MLPAPNVVALRLSEVVAVLGEFIDRITAGR
jgi:hypothetical protein